MSMLPDPLRLLISAYATRDLSPRRRSAAVRLLRHSAEARRLLKELKANRRRLRTLAPPALPAEFTARVVKSLPEVPPIIRPSVLASARGSGTSRLARYSAAATVLIAVAIGAYLFGSLPRDGSVLTRTATTRAPAKPGANLGPIMGPDDLVNNTEPPTTLDETEPDRAVVKHPPDAANPVSPASTPDPLGAIAPPPPRLTKVAPPRLLMLPVRDLDAPIGNAKLRKELTEAGELHIDLFCKDSTKGFDRLQAVLRGRGLRLVVDGLAQESLKRKLRAQYLIYCDDLTAEEWGKMFEALAAADKAANDNLFDQVVVLPFDAVDQKDLTNIAGADLTQPDTRRPRVGAKKDDRLALAATLTPWRTSATSKDVRQFLDAHSDRAAGAVAVVLVLRMPSN